MLQRVKQLNLLKAPKLATGNFFSDVHKIPVNLHWVNERARSEMGWSEVRTCGGRPRHNSFALGRFFAETMAGGDFPLSVTVPMG